MSNLMPWELTDPQQQQRNPAVVKPVPKPNRQLPNGMTLVNPGTQNTRAASVNNTLTPFLGVMEGTIQVSSAQGIRHNCNVQYQYGGQ